MQRMIWIFAWRKGKQCSQICVCRLILKLHRCEISDYGPELNESVIRDLLGIEHLDILQLNISNCEVDVRAVLFYRFVCLNCKAFSSENAECSGGYYY